MRKLNFSKLGTLSFPLEARKFGAIKFHFSKMKIRNFFRMFFFFNFLSSESSFLKYKKKEKARNFRFLKYKKFFEMDFFSIFSGLGLKVAQVGQDITAGISISIITGISIALLFWKQKIKY